VDAKFANVATCQVAAGMEQHERGHDGRCRRIEECDHGSMCAQVWVLTTVVTRARVLEVVRGRAVVAAGAIDLV
jgi:hypothetical protein